MSSNNNPFFSNILLAELNQEGNEDFVQLIAEDEEAQIDHNDLPANLPILPLKNTVLFPGVVIPITVGRKKSILLVKKAFKGNRVIGVISQKSGDLEDPSSSELYSVGTIAKIVKMIVLPDGSTTIIIQGKQRFKVEEFIDEEDYIQARIKPLLENFPSIKQKKTKALIESLKDAASKILRLSPEIPQEAQLALDNIHSPGFLTHFLASNLNADVAQKQGLLEIEDGFNRASQLLVYMLKEVKVLQLKFEIQQKAHIDIDQQQRDYFLRQQMKVLQDELGFDGPDQEIEELKEKASKKDWPEYVQKHFNKELDKIVRMNPAAAEFPVAMNYVELLIELPWNEVTKDNFDLTRAKKILDKAHFGLDKVKNRIIEYLAVLKLKKDMKGPILCFYGPPGVGKTSLGKSIAEALDRKYIRISLGGVHDEAEIRGHRKTYVAALPGKIIQNLKKSKKSNPVFILDEIDKVGSDFRGDPSSALLEVLDPEQNSTFVDNYLEIEYDLSKVLFIATANRLDTINPALRDRMEVIEINGYTQEEKVEIAIKHLIPKQRKDHGLKATDIQFKKSGISKIIEGFTRESGVRNLEREIGSVIRNAAKSIALEEKFTKSITADQVIEILGPQKFDKDEYQDNKTAGVVTGLAWTQAGGEILFIESSLSRGKGKLTLSGQLGDVMKESAVTALSYLKSKAEVLGLDYRIFDNYDLHVHVPAGAVPKDGPSAGITMFTSLVSVFTQRKVKSRLAMTGEITLRGKVLPVGAIREKLLAARRAGIKEIILSARNERDVLEIDERYRKDLTINYVDRVDEVLEIALLKEKVTNPIVFSFQDKGSSLQVVQ